MNGKHTRRKIARAINLGNMARKTIREVSRLARMDGPDVPKIKKRKPF